MYCRECGSEINDSKDICENCGVKADLQSTFQSTKMVKESFNKACKIVIALMILIFILFAILYFLIGRDCFFNVMIYSGMSVIALIVFKIIWNIKII